MGNHSPRRRQPVNATIDVCADLVAWPNLGRSFRTPLAAHTFFFCPPSHLRLFFCSPSHLRFLRPDEACSQRPQLFCRPHASASEFEFAIGKRMRQHLKIILNVASEFEFAIGKRVRVRVRNSRIGKRVRGSIWQARPSSSSQFCQRRQRNCSTQESCCDEHDFGICRVGPTEGQGLCDRRHAVLIETPRQLCTQEDFYQVTPAVTAAPHICVVGQYPDAARAELLLHV